MEFLSVKIKLFLTLLAGLLLTGCVDIFHAVSLHKGRARVTVRFTMDKSILDMVSSFSDGEEFDFSEIEDLSDEYFDEFTRIAAEITPINTDYLVGAEMSFVGPADQIIETLEGSEFIPVKNEGIYEIAVPGLNDEDSSDPMTASFLAGSKYTLLVDLSGDLRNIRNARVRLPEALRTPESGSDIMINTYGSSLLIEMPLFYLMESTEDLVIELLP